MTFEFSFSHLNKKGINVFGKVLKKRGITLNAEFFKIFNQKLRAREAPLQRNAELILLLDVYKESEKETLTEEKIIKFTHEIVSLQDEIALREKAIEYK